MDHGDIVHFGRQLRHTDPGGVPALFLAGGERIVRNKAQEAIDEAKQRGESPDVDASQLQDFGTELSPAQLWYVQIGSLLGDFWFLLVPATIIVCLGIAAMARRGP